MLYLFERHWERERDNERDFLFSGSLSRGLQQPKLGIPWVAGINVLSHHLLYPSGDTLTGMGNRAGTLNPSTLVWEAGISVDIQTITPDNLPHCQLFSVLCIIKLFLIVHVLGNLFSAKDILNIRTSLAGHSKLLP